jgi:hypothetical protein
VLGEIAKQVEDGGRSKWSRKLGAGKVLTVSGGSAASYLELTLASQDVPRYHPASFRCHAHICHLLLGKFFPFRSIVHTTPIPIDPTSRATTSANVSSTRSPRPVPPRLCPSPSSPSREVSPPCPLRWSLRPQSA